MATATMPVGNKGEGGRETLAAVFWSDVKAKLPVSGILSVLMLVALIGGRSPASEPIVAFPAPEVFMLPAGAQAKVEAAGATAGANATAGATPTARSANQTEVLIGAASTASSRSIKASGEPAHRSVAVFLEGSALANSQDLDEVFAGAAAPKQTNGVPPDAGVPAVW